jgi:hypothetical protein
MVLSTFRDITSKPSHLIVKAPAHTVTFWIPRGRIIYTLFLLNNETDIFSEHPANRLAE